MPRLEMFPLTTWIRFFSDSGAKSLERIQEALEHLEDETYTPEKFMSDSVLMWSDMTNGWWNAVRQSVSGPVPTIFLKVLSDDQAGAQRDIPVDAAETDGTIEVTPPLRLGDSPDSRRIAGRADVKPENLDVVWHPGKKRCLRVDVRRLLPKIDDPKTGDASAAAAAAAAAAAKRQAGVAQTDTPRFNPGLYQSLVHLNGKLLAQVMILVEETKS